MQADGQGVATNQTPLQLGLLKDNLEDRFSLSQLGDLTKDETKEAKEAKPAAPAAGEQAVVFCLQCCKQPGGQVFAVPANKR